LPTKYRKEEYRNSSWKYVCFALRDRCLPKNQSQAIFGCKMCISGNGEGAFDDEAKPIDRNVLCEM
jgi:hypothetical protein